jgi:hypothetical protein
LNAVLVQIAAMASLLAVLVYCGLFIWTSIAFLAIIRREFVTDTYDYLITQFGLWRLLSSQTGLLVAARPQAEFKSVDSLFAVQGAKQRLFRTVTRLPAKPANLRLRRIAKRVAKDYDIEGKAGFVYDFSFEVQWDASVENKELAQATTYVLQLERKPLDAPGGAAVKQTWSTKVRVVLLLRRLS